MATQNTQPIYLLSDRSRVPERGPLVGFFGWRKYLYRAGRKSNALPLRSLKMKLRVLEFQRRWNPLKDVHHVVEPFVVVHIIDAFAGPTERALTVLWSLSQAELAKYVRN